MVCRGKTRFVSVDEVFCLVGRVLGLVKSCEDLQIFSKCCRGLIDERGLTGARVRQAQTC